jgi:hypothetical protein
MSSLHDDLKDEILTLLGSSVVGSIRFIAAGIKVGGTFYSDLIGPITAGVLPIKIDPSLPPEIPGQYIARNAADAPNTLKIRDYPPFPAPLVVHELTHAAIDFLDLQKHMGRPRRDGNTFTTRGLHRTENEGIAYIAECLYCRLTHKHYSQHTPEQLARLPRVRHLGRVADAIAGRILASGVKFYHVTEDEIRWMRNAVGQHPKYREHRDESAPSDGFRMEFELEE